MSPSAPEFLLLKALIWPVLDTSIEFFTDFNSSALYALKNIPQSEYYFYLYVNNVNGDDVDFNYHDILARLVQCDSQLLLISIQLLRFKLQILKDLPKFTEIKQLIREFFYKFLEQAILDFLECFDQILAKLVSPLTCDKKHLHFFTRANVDLHLVHDNVSIFFSGLDGIQTDNTEMFSRGIELLDFLDSSKTYQAASPIFQEYQKLVRNFKNNELLGYSEYLLALNLAQINIYDEYSVPSVMTSNLSTLYKVAYLTIKMFDELDDLIAGVTLQLKMNGKSSAYDLFLDDLFEIIRGFSTTNSDRLYYIIGQLLINLRCDNDTLATDLEHRILYIHDFIMEHHQLYTIFWMAFQRVYNKSQVDIWTVLNNFKAYFEEFIEKFNDVVEQFLRPGGRDVIQSFFKDDTSSLDFYKEGRGLIKLGNAINLKEKRQILSLEKRRGK